MAAAVGVIDGVVVLDPVRDGVEADVGVCVGVRVPVVVRVGDVEGGAPFDSVDVGDGVIDPVIVPDTLGGGAGAKATPRRRYVEPGATLRSGIPTTTGPPALGRNARTRRSADTAYNAKPPVSCRPAAAQYGAPVGP